MSPRGCRVERGVSFNPKPAPRQLRARPTAGAADGRTVEVATPLPLCRFVSLTWQPPPSPFRSSGVQLGREALAHAGRALGPDSAPAEPGWLLFAAAPVDGRSLSFKDRKPDRHGVAVQASGIVPLYARRADGTTCTASGIPMAEPVPGWLVEALGGRWGRS